MSGLTYERQFLIDRFHPLASNSFMQPITPYGGFNPHVQQPYNPQAQPHTATTAEASAPSHSHMPTINAPEGAITDSTPNTSYVANPHVLLQSHPLQMMHTVSSELHALSSPLMANQHQPPPHLHHYAATADLSPSAHAQHIHAHQQIIEAQPPAALPDPSHYHMQLGHAHASVAMSPLHQHALPIMHVPQASRTANLQFEVVLNAPTAAAQRLNDIPVTYLNKGQPYAINLAHRGPLTGIAVSNVRIMFHEQAHRKLAANYWSFWHNQQPKSGSEEPRAIDIEKASSTGIAEVEQARFDRVSFKWNLQLSAKVQIKLNCLSTDFSRVKGVKGIPLRVHFTTTYYDGSGVEKCEHSFCKIKLFRDKGAERKNKDDQRHLEKISEKLKGRNSTSNPLLMMYAPVSQVTFFQEVSSIAELSQSEELVQLDSPSSLATDVAPELDPAVLSRSRSRRYSALTVEYGEPLDCDPAYTPSRKRRAVLCLYVRFSNQHAYQAVYLDHLTLEDLIAKLAEKLQFQPSSITHVIRITDKGVQVEVDDRMIAEWDDEEDFVVDCHFSNMSDTVTLILRGK